MGTLFSDLLILKGFKPSVLELLILNELRRDFADLLILRGLADWAATFTHRCITESYISQVGTRTYSIEFNKIIPDSQQHELIQTVMGMASIDFDFTFPCSYELGGLGDFPGNGKFQLPVYHFPSGSRDESGLWLRVNPSGGRRWIGSFANDDLAPAGPSRVLSSPDPNKMCVVAHGGAYIVDVENPEIWQKIPLMPVIEVRAVLEQKLLVFGDFTGLAAYGMNGLIWKTDRLCWDELRITKIDGNTVEGTGYDPTGQGSRTRFAVDLKSGRSMLPSPFPNSQ